MKLFFAVLLCASCSLIAVAQNDSEPPHFQTKLDGGYMFGGIFRQNFAEYISAFPFSISAGVQINSRFAICGGTGYFILKNYRMIPLFAEIETYTGKHKRGLFDARVGYVFAEGNRASNNKDYRFRGGLMLSPSAGINFYQGAKLRIFAALFYQFQLVSLHYALYSGGEEISSHYDYHFIGTKIGIAF